MGVHPERLVDECRVVENRAVERDDRGHPADLELGERPACSLHRLRPRRAGDDQLREQRVERAGHRVADDISGVDSNTGSGGKTPLADVTGRRQEPTTGVLGVDAELEGVTTRGRVFTAQPLPVGDGELCAYEVDAAGLLRDGVLDLQSGVDLEERHRPVLADEELTGAGADVAGGTDDGLRSGVQLLDLLRRQERRRRLLHNFLMPPLQRAVAGADDDDLAVGVRQHLGLDVSRSVQVALDEALAATEGSDRFAHSAVEQLRDLLACARHLQPAAAAAERGLDGDRQSVLVGEREHLVDARDGVRRPGRHGRADLLGDVPCLDLVTERADRLRWRTDPRQPGVEDGFGELRVLGQEPVAGMHGVGAGTLGDVEHLADVEVGLRGGRSA